MWPARYCGQASWPYNFTSKGYTYVFSRLTARFNAWRTSRQSKKLDAVIPTLIPKFRYNIEVKLKQLGLVWMWDETLDAGTALYFVPASRLIRLNVGLSPPDRRMALAMLLVHMAVTKDPSNMVRLPPYFLHMDDLHNEEGAVCNERWTEYMHALDLILPHNEFKALVALFPQRPIEATQRIMEVSHATIRRRMDIMRTGLGPLHSRQLGVPTPAVSTI